MRSLLLCMTVIFMVSCQNPYGTVTTNDEKSEIIKTLFQEVSNENIAYLEKVFSDSLVFINPHEQTLNKTAFIAAVSGLFDLFEDISFDPVDGDALGAEIETTTYENGITWTNIWNNFKAKGAYTGQEVNFPFHISYQWYGNKITKEVQFFDTTVFDNEANAKAAQTKSSKKLIVLLELGVNKGFNKTRIEDALKSITAYIRANEPNTYDYNYFISKDEKSVTLMEKYLHEDDFITHVNNFENGPNMAPFFEMFSVKDFIVAGQCSDSLKNRMKAFPIDYRTQVGGWID